MIALALRVWSSDRGGVVTHSFASHLWNLRGASTTTREAPRDEVE
jgi:hypothetical protein